MQNSCLGSDLLMHVSGDVFRVWICDFVFLLSLTSGINTEEPEVFKALAQATIAHSLEAASAGPPDSLQLSMSPHTVDPDLQHRQLVNLQLHREWQHHKDWQQQQQLEADQLYLQQQQQQASSAHPAGKPFGSDRSGSHGTLEECGSCSTAAAADGVVGVDEVAGRASATPASPPLRSSPSRSARSPGSGGSNSSSGSPAISGAGVGGYTPLGICSDSGDEGAGCPPSGAGPGDSGASEFTDPLRRISVGEGEMSREVSSELPAASGGDGGAGQGLVVVTEQEPPPPWADGLELYDR